MTRQYNRRIKKARGIARHKRQKKALKLKKLSKAQAQPQAPASVPAAASSQPSA